MSYSIVEKLECQVLVAEHLAGFLSPLQSLPHKSLFELVMVMRLLQKNPCLHYLEVTEEKPVSVKSINAQH